MGSRPQAGRACARLLLVRLAPQAREGAPGAAHKPASNEDPQAGAEPGAARTTRSRDEDTTPRRSAMPRALRRAVKEHATGDAPLEHGALHIEARLVTRRHDSTRMTPRAHQKPQRTDSRAQTVAQTVAQTHDEGLVHRARAPERGRAAADGEPTERGEHSAGPQNEHRHTA